MIAAIRGVLTQLTATSAWIQTPGGITYEVLLPAFAAGRLSSRINEEIELTTLHFVESQNQGSTLFPRLAGFPTAGDRDFYLLFTSVKGIGPRKALRAMAMPVDRMAGAIADRDVALLQSLPEVGKRTAETIIVTLRDKVDAFLERLPAGPGGGSGGAGTDAKASATAGGAGSARSPGGSLVREAIEVMVVLGENRAQAAMWVDQVLADLKPDARPTTAEELVARVYAARS